MIGLFFSEATLFAVFTLGGFVLGWRLQAHMVAVRLREIAADTDALRAALSDAQVRRAARSL